MMQQNPTPIQSMLPDVFGDLLSFDRDKLNQN